MNAAMLREVISRSRVACQGCTRPVDGPVQLFASHLNYHFARVTCGACAAELVLSFWIQPSGPDPELEAAAAARAERERVLSEFRESLEAGVTEA